KKKKKKKKKKRGGEKKFFFFFSPTAQKLINGGNRSNTFGNKPKVTFSHKCSGYLNPYLRGSRS
ncbi:hypothetical protein HMPREF9509_00770, partial [Enterococcus faecalis TX0411]